MADALVAALRGITAHVTDDVDVCAAHGIDWTRRFHGPVRAVVRPTSSHEVAEVLTACARAEVPVIPQGGNTSLVGGSVPGAHDGPMVVLSTSNLTRLDPVDHAAGAVTAGAGVTLAALATHAHQAGWYYGVDLAARDSATVGGTIATNAGGVRVCAYGMTRAQVLGLEYVTADGSVVSRLAGLPKDNTGYDLAGLLTGSEGTLAVITAARLRLHARPPETMVVLVGVPSLHVANALVQAQPADARIFGAEIMDAAGLELVAGVVHEPVPLPGEWPYVLLLESTAIELPDDAVAVAAGDVADARRLWTFRERMSEAVSTLGVVHKLDISAPKAVLDELVTGIRAVAPHHVQVVVFGHLADGNIHIELAGLEADDDATDRAIFDLATRLGGVVSAEHGVGRAKAAWLSMSRSDAEIAQMYALKQALDPGWLLNPGALLQRPLRPGRPAADW